MGRGLLMGVGAWVVGWAAFARLEACATGGRGGTTGHARHSGWGRHATLRNRQPALDG